MRHALTTSLTITFAVLAVTFAVLAFGCSSPSSGAGGITSSGGSASSGGGSSGGSGGPAIPMDKIIDSYVAMICERMDKCGEGLEGLLFSSPEACRQVLGELMGAEINQGFEQVDKGLRKYDGEKAAQCVAAVKAMDCSVHVFAQQAPDPACEEVLLPNVEVGGECVSGDDCKSGLCLRAEGSAYGCVGKCAEPVKVGDSCQKADYCPKEMKTCSADGEVCGKGNTCGQGDRCAAVTKAKAGESCEQADCEEGAWCDQQVSVCKALGKEGQACDGNELSCVAGLICGADDKCGVPAKEGEACSPPQQLQTRKNPPCDKGLVCTPAADVTPRGPKAKDFVKGTCMKLAEAGAACEGSLQCKGIDQFCKVADGQTKGVCSPVPKAGEACADAVFRCMLPSKCVPDAGGPSPGQGTCKTEPSKVGAACSGDNCSKGLICAKDGTCHAQPKEGEACIELSGGGKSCSANGDNPLKCVSDQCVSACMPAK